MSFFSFSESHWFVSHLAAAEMLDVFPQDDLLLVTRNGFVTGFQGRQQRRESSRIPKHMTMKETTT